MAWGERAKRKLLYTRANRRIIHWSSHLVPPGFDGVDLYHISRFFFRALQRGDIAMRASAIAFRLFMALFPALIVLLTLIPFIPIPDFQQQLLDTFHDMLPAEVYKFIEGMLHDLVVKKHSALLSVSTLIGIFFASNSMDAILQGFRGSYHVTEWHTAIKQRLLSLGLMFVLTLLCIVATALMTLSSWVLRELAASGYELSTLERTLFLAGKWAVAVLITFMGISLLYYAGDPRPGRFKLITPGTVLALLLVLVLSQALAFFFDRITDYNALYGSIGAILAVQLWLYLNMLVILIGYELNASIARARHHGRRSLHVKGAAQQG